jgi:MinD-like ATPase involved in chromosome partitioning or flagellar assembly
MRLLYCLVILRLQTQAVTERLVNGEHHFADGIDSPDRLAFGLSGGQLATVVVGLLVANVLAHASLPAAVGVPLASFVALVSVALGWLRISGRPALEWLSLAARYCLRHREGSLLIVPGPPAPGTPAGSAEARSSEPGTTALTVIDEHRVLPLFDARRHRASRALRVVFFSLKGGVGRTTLSVELACWLAAFGEPRRGAREAAALRVALIDLDDRSPSVALRLGIPYPIRREAGPTPAQVRVMHRSGLQVLTAPSIVPSGLDCSARLVEELRGLDEDHFDVVVLDVAAGLAAGTLVALQEADDIFIVITPTAGGVDDAYRTTAALRRAGLRDRLACVVNRAGTATGLRDTITDLGLRVVAAVPDDPSLIAAENSHAPVSLSTTSPVSRAMAAVAEFVLRQRR